jgi:acyl-CoA dehydrogenase
MLQHSDGPLAVDDAALWQALVEAGFASMRVEGETITLADALALASEAARFGARIPLGDVLIADWLLSQCDADASTRYALAWPSELRLGSESKGGGISGVAFDIAADSGCTHLLACATDGRGEARLIVTELQFAEGAVSANMAGEPRGSCAFRDTPASVVTADIAHSAFAAIAALPRCAQMTGAMRRVLELVLEHAETRVQFGKPLAKLQAVQQMQAQIAGELALAEAIVDRAATGADLLAVAASSAMAKAVASEAAGKVAALAHQIHGAIGVSRQHELQHHTRALWAWRDERGAEDVWRKSVGERVLADGGAALWPALAQT